MKLLIALFFGGIIALTAIHHSYQPKPAVTAYYKVIVGEEGGETVYSVVLPDDSAYDYLTKDELDTVLQGKELYNPYK